MSWKHVVAILTLLVSTGATPVRPPLPDADEVILVSIGQRYLWYVVDGYVIFEAPVAVGVEDPFEYNGKKYDFETPRGMRKVIKKRPNPVWTVPEWHYFEKASQRGLKVVRVLNGETYTLGDSTTIRVRDHQVGRVNLFGNFTPFEPGIEIIFDNTIFIPPLGTPQREVPGALGPFALDMGSGYLIHGTHEYNEDSIGTAASHGCVRMHNEDIERLYELVPVGTRVYIGN